MMFFALHQVLMFKIGKFYEMYHMDADVGVFQLGLIYMSGALAHCGFPEIAFAKNSARLVELGPCLPFLFSLIIRIANSPSNAPPSWPPYGPGFGGASSWAAACPWPQGERR